MSGYDDMLLFFKAPLTQQRFQGNTKTLVAFWPSIYMRTENGTIQK